MMHVGGYYEYIGGYHEYMGGVQYIGGYHEYIGGCSGHWADIIMHVGGYHEYIGGCSVRHDFQYKLEDFATLLPHIHHDIPRCTEHTLYRVGILI